MPLIGATGDSSLKAYRGNYDDVPAELIFGDLSNQFPQPVFVSSIQVVDEINYKVITRILEGDARVLIFREDKDEIYVPGLEDPDNYYDYFNEAVSEQVVRPGARLVLILPLVAEGESINRTVFNRTYNNRIRVGRSEFSWRVTTGGFPAAENLEFQDVVNAPLNSQITSDSYTVSGLLDDVTYTARITGEVGRFRVNSGPLVSSAVVGNGDVINLVLRNSGDEPLFTTSVSFSISASGGQGTASTVWNVTTQEILTPIGLTFNDVFEAGFGVDIFSNVYTVNGLTPGAIYTAEIIGTNGFLTVNSGSQVKSATVNEGDELRLVFRTPLTGLTRNTVTVRISAGLNRGQAETTWAVTTKQINLDVIFTPRNFTNRTGVARNTLITSNQIIVSQIDQNISLPVEVSNADYRLTRNGVIVKDFTSPAQNIINNDGINLRVRSSGSFSTTVQSTLKIGNTSTTWSVTTQPPPPPPVIIPPPPVIIPPPPVIIPPPPVVYSGAVNHAFNNQTFQNISLTRSGDITFVFVQTGNASLFNRTYTIGLVKVPVPGTFRVTTFSRVTATGEFDPGIRIRSVSTVGQQATVVFERGNGQNTYISSFGIAYN